MRTTNQLFRDRIGVAVGLVVLAIVTVFGVDSGPRWPLAAIAASLFLVAAVLTVKNAIDSRRLG